MINISKAAFIFVLLFLTMMAFAAADVTYTITVNPNTVNQGQGSTVTVSADIPAATPIAGASFTIESTGGLTYGVAAAGVLGSQIGAPSCNAAGNRLVCSLSGINGVSGNGVLLTVPVTTAANAPNSITLSLTGLSALDDLGDAVEPVSSAGAVTLTVNVPDSQCTGVAPSNAALCAGDDSGLVADTPRTLVAACTLNIKCEYTCDAGFNLNGGICVANQCVNGATDFPGCITCPNGQVLDAGFCRAKTCNELGTCDNDAACANNNECSSRNCQATCQPANLCVNFVSTHNSQVCPDGSTQDCDTTCNADGSTQECTPDCSQHQQGGAHEQKKQAVKAEIDAIQENQQWNIALISRLARLIRGLFA